MRPVKSHVFRGKRYRFLRVPSRQLQSKEDRESGQVCLGFCNPPNSKGKTIKIDKDITGLEELDVIIHESLHAMAWDLDECAVKESATDLAKLLWKLGYKKTE